MRIGTKNKIVYLLAGCIAACSLLFGVSVRKTEKVRAATTAEFTFETGASVRIDTAGKTSGIRFRATFGQALYDTLLTDGVYNDGAEIGMIIVPDSYITAYDEAGATDYFTYFRQVKKKEKEQISASFSEEKLAVCDAGYRISGVMIGLKDYSRAFRAIAYYTTDGGASYSYTLNDDARSVSDVAKAAIENEGTVDYPKVYTDAQLSVLYGYAEGLLPRVVFDASKASHVQKFTNSTNENITVSQVEDEEWHFLFTSESTVEKDSVTYTLDKNYLEDLTDDVNVYSGVYFTVGVTELAVGTEIQVIFSDEAGDVVKEIVVSGFGQNNVQTLTMEEFGRVTTMTISGLDEGDQMNVTSFTAEVKTGENGGTEGGGGSEEGGGSEGGGSEEGGETGDYAQMTPEQLATIDTAEEMTAAIDEVLASLPDKKSEMTQDQAKQVVALYNAYQNNLDGKQDEIPNQTELWLAWFQARRLV